MLQSRRTDTRRKNERAASIKFAALLYIIGLLKTHYGGGGGGLDKVAKLHTVPVVLPAALSSSR